MSRPDPASRPVASAFTHTLRAALDPAAPAERRTGAREVARRIGLDGLDAALAQLERHPGGVWPLEVSHLASRIARLLDAVEFDGALSGMRDADASLAALASHLATLEWTEGAADAPPQVTTSLLDALEGLRLEDVPAVRAKRVTTTVASALRAALDWIGASSEATARVLVHDTALAVTVPAHAPEGAAAAAALLASVEGSLLPEATGRWTLRAPLHALTPAFLLLRRGGESLALPWHAVARVAMFEPEGFALVEEPRLAPLASESRMQQPAALIAHGARRAWFPFDRIVWRVAVRPEALVDPARPECIGCVTVEGIGRHLVLSPEVLLRGIEPAFVATPTEPRAAAPVLTVLTAASVTPLEEPVPATSSVLAPIAAPRVAPTPVATPVATSLDDAVDALFDGWSDDSVSADAAPIAEAAAVDPIAAAPVPAFTAHLEVVHPPGASAMTHTEVALPDVAPALEPPAERHVLVVEDSLVARLALAALLAREGCLVEEAPDAQAMRTLLPTRRWAMLCVDVALPDAMRGEHLQEALEASDRLGIACVALTRDAADHRLAHDAGVAHALRKPFETGEAERLLPLLLAAPEDRR